MEPFVQKVRGDDPDLFYINGWMQAHPQVTAGFTGRKGGISRPPFASLNCGLHVADNPDDVAANRKALAQAVGIPFERWAYGEQVHGCDIQPVTMDDAGKGTLSRESAFQGKDAFITSDEGICLGGLFADCVPLYFFDPVHKAVGLAHAGWKGTVLQIAAKTVEAMRTAFGTEPGRLLAAIGPSIGVCCYEVDETVISRVNEALGSDCVDPLSNGSESGRVPYRSVGTGKYMLNLQEVNRRIMMKAGILPRHIEITKLCTSCSTDLFFSHRKENGRTGRMAAWIGLKEQPRTS